MSGIGAACCASVLRVPYAMFGIGIAYGASVLRARYAMSSTDIAYGTSLPGLRPRVGEEGGGEE
eukprot:419083-Rhodomonas_salina.1